MTTASTLDPDVVIQELGSALVNDAAYAGLDWQALAVVFSEPGEGCQAVAGFWYDEMLLPASKLPAERDAVIDLFLDLQKAVEARFSTRFKACLLSVRREGLQIGLDFDFTDPARWAVTPENYQTKPLEFLQH